MRHLPRAIWPDDLSLYQRTLSRSRNLRKYENYSENFEGYHRCVFNVHCESFATVFVSSTTSAAAFIVESLRSTASKNISTCRPLNAASISDAIRGFSLTSIKSQSSRSSPPEGKYPGRPSSPNCSLVVFFHRVHQKKAFNHPHVGEMNSEIRCMNERDGRNAEGTPDRAIVDSA